MGALPASSAAADLAGVGPAVFLYCCQLHRLCRLGGVELPVTLFDAASSLVPGNGHSDKVRAGALARSGDFLPRLASCESEDPIAETRRAAFAAGWRCRRTPLRPRSRAATAAFVAAIGALAKAEFFARMPLP
jgi:hypothetical protein